MRRCNDTRLQSSPMLLSIIPTHFPSLSSFHLRLVFYHPSHAPLQLHSTPRGAKTKIAHNYLYTAKTGEINPRQSYFVACSHILIGDLSSRFLRKSYCGCFKQHIGTYQLINDCNPNGHDKALSVDCAFLASEAPIPFRAPRRRKNKNILEGHRLCRLVARRKDKYCSEVV